MKDTVLFKALKLAMLTAQCNGCRIMKPSVFTLVTYKPRYNDTVLSTSMLSPGKMEA